MTIDIAARPLVVHQVTDAHEARPQDGFELRTVALSVAASHLAMPVADLDCVRVAAARADLRCCPACRPAERRAA